MKRWLVATASVIVLAGVAVWTRRGATPVATPPQEATPRYVGHGACVECHAKQVESWRGSDHALAMQPANEQTVLGDFAGTTFEYAGTTSTFSKRDGRYFVRTDGPDGVLTEYEIAYAFGVRPLQQYLIAFPGGRLQALGIAWDSRPRERGGQRWFHVYEGERVDHKDVLHWTHLLQNWNFMCAECHSTDLRKNYRADSRSYETTFSEINVSCEACHGPASAHVAWARRHKPDTGDTAAVSASPVERVENMGLVFRLGERVAGRWVWDAVSGIARRDRPRESRVEVETCARCHARRGVISEEYVHGRSLLDTHRPSLLDEQLYFADGQIQDEVYEYGSFLQSRMFMAGVSCTDCHDPHAVTNLRQAPDRACARCHAPARFAQKSHHFHKPEGEGGSCVACHMPARTYMVVDPRRDHSFRIPRPDLSAKTGAPNACAGCHRDRPLRWATDAVARWYGPKRRSLEPHYGEALALGRSGAPGATAALTALIQNSQQPPIVRATALSLLRGVLTPGALQVVGAALVDSDPLVRQAALSCVDAIADPGERIGLASPLLADPVRAVRVDAARALANDEARLPADRRAPFQAALDEYLREQYANAERPEAHMNLGWLASIRGQHEAARRSFETALELEPAFVPAYVNLADALRQLGRDEEGERALRRALDLAPQSAAVHHALGLNLARRERTVDALEELQRATELDPSDPRLAYVYGVALHSSGKTRRALEVLAAASTRHPQDRELLIALATFSREAGDHTKALAAAERLLALAPTDPAAAQLVRELRQGP